MDNSNNAFVASNVFLSEDEGWNVEASIASKIEDFLRTLKVDTYNDQIVVVVNVYKLNS